MHELTEDAGHGGGAGGTVAPAAGRTPTAIVRYRRTLRAAPPQAFAAVARVVELLRYPVRKEDPGAAEIRFSALARTVTAKVVDAGPGHCTVVVEFGSLRWLGSGGSALVILPGVLLGAAVKAQDAFFAKGFLENVQRVLEGKGVGRDPARIPGMNALCEMLDIPER